MSDKSKAPQIGAVLTLKSKGRRGAVGATMGADGAGTRAYLIEGEPETAEQWARDFVHDLEKSGHMIEDATVVRSGETYSGHSLFHVRPGAFVYQGCEQLGIPPASDTLKRFSAQLAAGGIPEEKLRAVVAVAQYLDACSPQTSEEAVQAIFTLISEAKRSGNIFEKEKVQG